MERRPGIPHFYTPSGLPESFEEFEQLKQDQRDALRQYLEVQPRAAWRAELDRLFSPTPPRLSREEVESMEML
jgi:hypothetical protein